MPLCTATIGLSYKVLTLKNYKVYLTSVQMNTRLDSCTWLPSNNTNFLYGLSLGSGCRVTGCYKQVTVIPVADVIKMNPCLNACN